MRKKFEPTKNSEQKILDPQTTHEKRFWTHKIPTKPQWQYDTRPMRFTRPTMIRKLVS